MAILVDETTRVLVQGITGREAVAFTKDCLDYGTRIVAGVTPGKGGADVYGVPVYDRVAEAMRDHQPNAAVVSVPAPFAADAAIESLEAGIELVVIVSERLPRRDVVQVLSVASEVGGRVVGPNSLGLISPGRCKVGSVGGPVENVHKAFKPGRIGVMSRSGGMTTEIANMLTQSGMGQSTCVSVGGDPIVGLPMVDILKLFEQDDETDAVVFFSEPGGAQDQALADYVASARCRLPVVGFIAGLFADDMPGIRFGHAGAMVEPGGTTTREKVASMRRAGIPVVDRLSHLIDALREQLETSSGSGSPSASATPIEMRKGHPAETSGHGEQGHPAERRGDSA